MDHLINIIVALLAPLPAVAKYHRMQISWLLYPTGALLIGYALKVLIPVAIILAVGAILVACAADSAR